MNKLTARAVQGTVQAIFYTLLVGFFFTFPHVIVAVSLGNVA